MAKRLMAGQKDTAPVLVVGCVVRDMTYAIKKVPDAFTNLWEKGKISVPAAFAPIETTPGAFILPDAKAMSAGEEALAGTVFELIGSREETIGGAAFNAAVRCLAQFDLRRVQIRFSCGDDPDGDAIWANLSTVKGLDMSSAQRAVGRGSAKSWILRRDDGERFIFTHRTAPQDVPEHAFLANPGLLILCNCADPKTSLAFLDQAAQQKGMAVAWIAARNDLLYLNDLGDFPFDFGDKPASCLCLTKDELSSATGYVREKLMRAFRVVAITDGGHGGEVWFTDEMGVRHVQQYTAAPILFGKLTDTTGAGDAFATTLAVALYKGVSASDAIDAARFVAAKCVCHQGATGDLVIERVAAGDESRLTAGLA